MSKQGLRDSSVPYIPLPQNLNQQNVIFSPVYYHRPNQTNHYLRRGVIFAGALLLLSATLVVSVGYRGKEFGVVNSEGGRVRARGRSYVNATLDLNGFEVVHDVIYLIEDWAKGVIPFDTTTKVNGVLGLCFLKIPLKAKVACEVSVNTRNQTIIRQDCHAQ
ncbi:tRNA modification GTPase MnmE [Gossypium arboreum]|uniref:tRNA modification GTPase MnmE n=1 Tax=Gossypium arboreum TaxID=29729 RepID=A0A0B0NM94_GOSAR|nr:tRNA modification GTPase MnmE [Gossypium arboreum]